jgi:hypothetical protein
MPNLKKLRPNGSACTVRSASRHRSSRAALTEQWVQALFVHRSKSLEDTSTLPRSRCDAHRNIRSPQELRRTMDISVRQSASSYPAAPAGVMGLAQTIGRAHHIHSNGGGHA